MEPVLLLFVIAIISIIASGITLFSGFGLGTILLPVFSFYLPLELAILATAIVHLANNLTKIGFFYQQIDKKITIIFGLPALIFALIGAYLITLINLFDFSFLLPLMLFKTSLSKIIIGSLIILFALFEFIPVKSKKLNSFTLIIGGMLSGFFGGLSGHQGALRSAFLAKANQTPEAFVATNAAIASIVDLARISVYLLGIDQLVTTNDHFKEIYPLVLTSIIFAFLGIYFGKKLVKKITINWIQKIVGILLILIGIKIIFNF